jgi:hypothetical protein
MTDRLMKLALGATIAFAVAACGDSRQDMADTLSVDTTAARDTGIVSTPLGEPIAQEGTFLHPNSATREQLIAAGLSDHAADALVGGRPYDNMLAVNRVLTTHVPDSAARSQAYARVWMPIDLNTASAEEIQLIPGVGRRMRHEFEEYRPYSNMAQFRREIGKYVNEQEVARLERYVEIR